MEDLLSKVKGKRSPLERIMSFIPLYHGYKEKELRRESDRILRNHIQQTLLDTKQDVKKIQVKLVKNNQVSTAKDLDNIITKCDTVAQRISRAEGGYGGFWDATKIKENELDKLYEIDADLATLAENVKQSGQSMLEKSADKPFVITDNLEEYIDLFNSRMTSRTELLRGFG